jgi:hypothetical protein
LPNLLQPGRHRLPERDPPAVTLERQLEYCGEHPREADGQRHQNRGQHEEHRRP